MAEFSKRRGRANNATLLICGAFLCLLISASQANAGEPSPRAEVIDEIPAPPPTPPTVSETPSDNEKAAVVDLSDGESVLPRSRGPWTLPAEEAMSAERPVPQPKPAASDPEVARTFPEDDKTPTEPPVKAIPQPRRLAHSAADPEAGRTFPEEPPPPPEPKVVQHSSPPTPQPARDPEAGRAYALVDLAEDPPPAVTPTPTTPPAHREQDTPRFAAGAGLEKETADATPSLAHADPPTKNAINPETENAVAGKAPDAIAGKESTEKPKETKAKGETEDPEQRFAELLKQIELNREELLKARKAQDDRVAKALEGMPGLPRSLDPKERAALQALLSNTPAGTLNGVITDASGKQLVYARVKIADLSDTAVSAPLPTGFPCAGNFSTKVLSGAVGIEVHRGRFAPTFMQGVRVKPGAVANCTVPLGQPAHFDFAARGWHLADLDIGLRAGQDERKLWLGPPPDLHALLIAAQAHGVDVLGVQLPFEDAATAREIERCAASGSSVLVLPSFVGPRHPFHGSALGLGIKSDWRSLPREIGLPEQPLFEVFDEIRARGGLAAYTDLFGTRSVDLRTGIFTLLPRLEQSNYFGKSTGNLRLYSANELPLDAMLGPAFDAFAFDGSEAATQLWFNLLNQGYTIPAIGAGGGSLEGGRLPFGQTLIQTQGPLTRESVLNAIKENRTVITFGPAVFCKILERDKGPGAILAVDGRPLTLQIQAFSCMEPGAELEKIEVIRNGEVVFTHAVSPGESVINGLNWPFTENASGSAWYMVRVSEHYRKGSTQRAGGTAWTSPIHFRGTSYAPPALAISRIKGKLCRGLTPVAGTVTAVAAGQAPRQIATDAQGRFSVELPASGSLIFAADGCEPLAKRIFEHPAVQHAMGALAGESKGSLGEQFGRAALLPGWRLLLSELSWEISLVPTGPENTTPSAAPANQQKPGEK
ncbi:MAG TPA: hypothetical protein VGP72_29740 [Planctomycetota bacterium]|jgi:hypothetical protein